MYLRSRCNFVAKDETQIRTVGEGILSSSSAEVRMEMERVRTNYVAEQQQQRVLKTYVPCSFQLTLVFEPTPNYFTVRQDGSQTKFYS